jgi:hypothetical protein
MLLKPLSSELKYAVELVNKQLIFAFFMKYVITSPGHYTFRLISFNNLWMDKI